MSNDEHRHLHLNVLTSTVRIWACRLILFSSASPSPDSTCKVETYVQPSSKILHFFLYVCSCAIMHRLGSEDNFWESVLSFQYVGSPNQGGHPSWWVVSALTISQLFKLYHAWLFKSRQNSNTDTSTH